MSDGKRSSVGRFFFSPMATAAQSFFDNQTIRRANKEKAIFLFLLLINTKKGLLLLLLFKIPPPVPAATLVASTRSSVRVKRTNQPLTHPYDDDDRRGSWRRPRKIYALRFRLLLANHPSSVRARGNERTRVGRRGNIRGGLGHEAASHDTIKLID